ncbi:hypothetical protein ACTS93_02375 [Empedobacter falsenii]
MKTKTIYVFDMEQNTIVKISKKARKRAKKIIKKRELEARIVANVEKAEAFDAYMANKIMSDNMEEKRSMQKTEREMNIKEFNQRLTNQILTNLNQAHQKVLEAFS